TLSGSGLTGLLARAKAAELWHSQPDKGLAVHFLTEAQGPRSLALKTEPGQVSIEAGPFLDKIGLGRPQTDQDLAVGAVDESRMVIAMKLA
ncbi:MAG: hypothetical protein JRJ59_00775, partial [Deltaproteobacteria bacterium]|nr:hypothetical protein [Deltaproteobacteria bacterium]